MPISAFTCEFPKLVNVLTLKVGISSIEDDTVNNFVSIWDTGATNSSITQNVVNKLALQPVSKIKVNTGGGTVYADVYIVNIHIEPDIHIMKVPVTLLPIINADVLIGMDVINFGDLAISNHQGKTTFSFRIPSCDHANFVGYAKQTNMIEQLKNKRFNSNKKKKR